MAASLRWFILLWVKLSAFFSIIYVAMPDEFPAVQGGGSLILAWQIKNKRVLVVGGGEVGYRIRPPAHGAHMEE